jgi:hypothetical protein
LEQLHIGGLRVFAPHGLDEHLHRAALRWCHHEANITQPGSGSRIDAIEVVKDAALRPGGLDVSIVHPEGENEITFGGGLDVPRSFLNLPVAPFEEGPRDQAHHRHRHQGARCDASTHTVVATVKLWV